MIPKTIPKCKDSGENTHGTQWITNCVIAKIYQRDVVRIHSQVIKEKDTESLEKPSCRLPYALSLSWAVIQSTFFPSNKNAAISVGCFCPGKPIRDSAPKVFIGARCISTLCLARSKIPGSQKEGRCLAKSTLFVQTI